MKEMNHMIQKIFQILSNKNNKSEVCQCLNRPKIGHKMNEMNHIIQKIFQILSNKKKQIGSMSMPQPPQNWPPNERDESHDTKSLPDSNESEEQSKRTRGLTMMHLGWGKDGGNLHIELNEHGQVIGSEGTRLSSKLGVLARMAS
ncbi:hypothetical protein MTR67_039577 [Solanum verrucosum]|uniref:Uncharacterized protein n=1 Tax=Solanum verrucosum TaxID=315347 RepID=A0AAF0UHG5_SOLVR|nr:hypothetical protein MTR67_039577 [Solanum verrucosum]